MSGNALYHAAAWAKYYSVVTSIGGRSDEDMTKLAGQVLVSALAVPVGQKAEELGAVEGKGKVARLTALLGLAKPPSRNGLLSDAVCLFPYPPTSFSVTSPTALPQRPQTCT